MIKILKLLISIIIIGAFFLHKNDPYFFHQLFHSWFERFQEYNPLITNFPWLQEYPIVSLLLPLFLLQIALYLFLWQHRKRRMSQLPLLFIETPPQNLSPGKIRYLSKLYFDRSQFAVLVLSMAVKRLLTVSVHVSWVSIVRTKNTDSSLYSEEETLLDSICFDKEDVITIKQYFSKQGILEKKIESLYENQFKNIFFTQHYFVLLIPIVATGFMLCFLFTLWVPAVAFSNDVLAGLVMCGITTLVNLSMLSKLANKPTDNYLQLNAEINGFKQYLQSISPQTSVELFEKYLPYAIALDLDKEWNQKFENLILSGSYHPEWFAANQNVLVNNNKLILRLASLLSVTGRQTTTNEITQKNM